MNTNINDNIGLISIIMTTYNVENYIEKAINSVLNQTYKNIELIIVDDVSVDKTIEIIRSYNDPRISLYRNKINCGTYYSKNYGISVAKGEYIAIHDSDDYSAHNRLEEQAKVFVTNKKVKLVRCQYCRVDSNGKQISEPKAAFVGSLIKKEVFEKVGYYDSVRVAADDEFDSRIKLYFGWAAVITIEMLLYFGLQREHSLTTTIKIGSKSRLDYVENYKAWHESIKQDLSKCYVPYPLLKRSFEASKEITVKFNDRILPKNNVKKLKTNGEVIIATVVTIPSRISMFEKVVESIINQVDELRVYLNNVEEIPSYLKQKKITVESSKDFGDLADNGKFFWSNNMKGFHFTIDDDIIYPSDYIKQLKKKLSQYQFNAVVGVHGVLIKKNSFKNYYDRDSRIVYTFGQKLEHDKYVNIIGTGTMAYHTKFFGIDPKSLTQKRMVDIFVGIEGLKRKIPFITINRHKNWLKEIETPKETRIYNALYNNDQIQTKLINENDWEINFADNDLNNKNYKSLTNIINEDILQLKKELVHLKELISIRDEEITKKNEEIIWHKNELIKVIDWYQNEIIKIKSYYESKMNSKIFNVIDKIRSAKNRFI